MLEPDLGVVEALADLVVGDRDRPLLTDVIGIGGEGGALAVPVLAELRRRGGVVPVTVDDHVADRIVGPTTPSREGS